MIRMVLDVLLMMIDLVWDGITALGPRFQGFVLGIWAAMAMFAFACTLAIWG
ncbi:hypothetical protein [uncultured Acidaminococcus sp.]|uniref:hypothetical protein n=1 Tax=uncultured Acidaminococcus sp. TaxID=352152 RepID=UPI002599B232|nr:hypothetical protein [uncultured Acidaminococcus sp.]